MLPLVFAFTCSMDGTTAPGAKDHMLQAVLQCISHYCPNIVSVNMDKDQSELSMVSEVFPDARRQLYYWHAIKYLETHLAEDKPPAKYDPCISHAKFDFIDPMWAPGITSGWLKDGVLEKDADCDKPENEEDEDYHQVCSTKHKINSIILHVACHRRGKQEHQLVSHLCLY